MRITSGILGGRQIAVPSGPVRPTQDKVRQALFSILAARVPGCRFLDLYAGSGSVGIEAWSRGADSVVWVELDRRTAAVLRQNAGMCGEGGRVVVGDSLRVLKKGLENCPFDIIFADPPYEKRIHAGRTADLQSRLLGLILEGGMLAGGGLVVLEQAAGAAGAETAGWILADTRRYGAAELRFFRLEQAAAAEGDGKP